MQDKNLIILGNHIKNLRKQKGLTLSALCYRNGLEPSTVSRIESGLTEAKYLTLLKLANAFNMPIYEFLKIDNTKLNNEKAENNGN